MPASSNRTAPLQVQAESPDEAIVRLRLIGQMEAWTVTSENVLPAGRKTRALLAAVALSAPRPALRGRLAELLWSRRPEEQARASLRQEIHRLLEALQPAKGEVLIITRDHLALRPGAVWVDVEEVMRATTNQPASLSLLDGDLLEDLDGIDPTFDAWLNTERERLRDRARGVAEALLREQVEPEAAIPAAQRLLQIDRAHEGAWRALMRAHAARGERGMAIQAYDRCRAVLADLLDASPSAETQKLLAEIRGPSGSRMPLRPPSPPQRPPEVEDDEPPAVLEPRRVEVHPRARWSPCRRHAAATRRHHRGRGPPRARPRRRDHHGAGAFSLDVRRRLEFAGPLRGRYPRRDGDTPHLRPRLPAGWVDPARAQPTAYHSAAAGSARRQPGGVGAAVRSPVERPVVIAGRDRL